MITHPHIKDSADVSWPKSQSDFK